MARGSVWPRERLGATVLLGVLSLQFVLLALHEAREDALTVDEPIYLASGLAALTEAEHNINCEAPAVPKALNAIPLWLAGIEVPVDGVWDEVRPCDPTGLPNGAFTQEFNEHLRDQDQLRDAAYLGRLVPIAETVMIGFGLYVLAAALAGRAAGVVAAAAWLTTPLVVGLGHLDSLDVAFTLAVVWSAVALERYLRDPSETRLGWLTIAAGALLLTRHTGVLVVAVAVGVVIAVQWGRPRLIARDVLVVLVGAWAIVWGATAIVTPESLTGSATTVPDTGDTGAPTRAAVAVLDALPLPWSYESGLRFQLENADLDSPGFMLGSSWRGARWWFWPAATMVKLPGPALVLVALGLLGGWGLAREHRRRAWLAAWLPAALLALFLLPFPKPVGIRYLLPALALFLVLGSARVVSWVSRLPRGGRRWVGVVACLALAVQVGSLWDATPHSIAWTAPPFRPGYAVVSESNLDWGQDGRRLASWMEGRDATIAYFGGDEDGPMQVAGARPLREVAPAEVRGWVAASASLLTSYERERFSWLRAYCHVGNIGGSILLYRFDEPPTDEPGPDTPVGPCPAGSPSSSRR